MGFPINAMTTKGDKSLRPDNRLGASSYPARRIILEATFDLTHTYMRLSLGSCGGFVSPIWKKLCAYTLHT
jgi:hypothetical protein